MRTKEFLAKLAHDRLVQAIQEVESKTSAEVRVYIQRGKFTGDPLDAAAKRFHRLRMNATDHRASVLIWVAPREHKFAVVGDEAIHQRCGDVLWQSVVDKMRDHFRSERFSDALIDAVRDVGEALAEHVPKRAASA